MVSCYCPIGDGSYMKATQDLCAPWMIEPQEGDTIYGTCQGTYKKKEVKTATGAPPATQMSR